MSESFADVTLRIKNFAVNLTSAVFPGFRRHSPPGYREPPQCRTMEELDAYQANFWRGQARGTCGCMTVIQETPGQLKVTFAKEDGEDVSLNASLFTKYLTRALSGTYGASDTLTSIRIGLPVLVSADPKFDKEVARAIGARRGEESPQALGVKRGLHRDPQFADSPLEILLQGQKCNGPRVGAEHLAAAAVQLAPAFDMVDFEKLEETMNRKALIELEFPCIEMVLNAKPTEIAFLLKRMKLDLNLANYQLRPAGS